MTCPSLVELSVGSTEYSIRWELTRIVKELLTYVLVWYFAALISLDWLKTLTAIQWLMLPFMVTIVALPIVQSPIKFGKFMWMYFVPDGDEETDQSEKRKGMMRLTDDGELEEITEDGGYFQITDEEADEIKFLARKERR